MRKNRMKVKGARINRYNGQNKTKNGVNKTFN